MKPLRTLLLTFPLVLVTALLVPGAGWAGKVTLTRLASINGASEQVAATARTPDGVLHVMYPTVAPATHGLATMAISPGGKPGPQIQALSGWDTTQPGLVTLTGGTLAAFFGAISPGNVSSLYAITSTDGGATWTAPIDVRSSSSLDVFAYASPLTAAVSGTTPVIALPHGDLVIQQGLGAAAPASVLNTPAAGDVGDLSSAVDAATGEVVESWYSIATSLASYLQGAAPTVGAAQLVPGQVRHPVVIAGRDTGPGVFAPYTTDGTHVRLLRYGAGSVAVGKVSGITANNLAAVTSLDGRIWVIWGAAGTDFAVTRSNKAVTRFEPIQHVNANAFSLWRVFGDGRLGPLDLFTDQVPQLKTLVPPGLYYGRVLPELTAGVSVKKVKNSKGVVVAFKLTVTVTDAGDAVSGATVSVKGKSKKTNASGVAKLTLPGSTSGPVTVTVTAPSYQVLTKKVGL
ncbi:MAG: hypothetical protein QOJ25_3198 [Solirubrobacteraceae bacterium]|jgi:hypothetical protein|nr:hypothetical protein [Solirubrobacteraceae bacterium]